MEKKFFVVTGNEHGINSLHNIEMLTEKKADVLFSKYYIEEEHFAIVMYEIKNDKIIEILKKIDYQ
jgi:hypothetical protein